MVVRQLSLPTRGLPCRLPAAMGVSVSWLIQIN